MKTFALQRRLASDILGVGRNKIWFDPLRLNDIQQALTRSDIDELIKDKAIFSKKKYHKKTRHKRKNKGTARIKKKINFRKRDYMRRIRKIRKYLKNMKESRKISVQEYHKFRKEAKAGKFTGLRHFIENVKSLKAGKSLEARG